MLHVSERLVEQAKKLQRDGVPELAAMVDAGDVTINVALELCRRNYNRYSFVTTCN